MAFSRNVRMLLGVHDLSAGEFAGMLGISGTTLSYWLNDHRDPSAENLIQIAEFFDVPATALMRDEPTDFISLVGDPDRFAKVENEIFWSYRGEEPPPPPTPIRKKKKKK